MAKTILRKAVGDSIKAIEGNRVAGYLVRFTNADDPDLHNEYFTKATNFWLKEHPIIGKPVLIDHAFDEHFKSVPVGIIDFVKEDNIGLWIEAKLKERAEYEDMLRGWKDRKWLSNEELADSDIPMLASNLEKAVKSFFATAKAQWSSGALPQSVEVAEDGHIKSWAIIEGTGVYTPAEPDGTQINLKSLIQSLHTQAATPAKDAQHIEREAETVTVNINSMDKASVEALLKALAKPSTKTTKGTDKMNPEIIQQVIAWLQSMLGEQGVPEAEAIAMASEIEEEMKAEDEALPEEEKKKEVDEELVKAWTGRALAKYEAKLAKKQALKHAAQAQLNSYKMNAPVSEEAAKGLPKYTGGGNNRVSVGENLKYAHLSASDMALGIMLKLAPAKSQGIPVNVGDAFSEAYLKTFANKAAQFAASEPYSKSSRASKSFGHRQQAQSADMALKSLIPFKANELNASDISGQGSDWISEWWSTDLWERERFERHYDSLVSRGMQVQTIPQGADTAHFSTEGSDPVAYVAPQANSVGADGRPETTANFSPYGTGVVDCTPLEIKIATSQTVILEEDSVINVVQNVNRQLNEAALETRDKLLVNGDDSLGTTNINYDGTQVPLGLQRPYYTAADGFRLHGLTNNAVDASNTLALNTYRLTLAELDPELRQYYDRMVFMIDPTTEMASLAIPEIATDDVRRSFATVTSGRILNVYGIDVLVNGFIPQTDTDGKVTATGNVANRGSILLVYAPYWGFAYKRNITLETARNIWSGTNDYVMSMRIGMVARGTNATALTYNVATAVS